MTAAIEHDPHFRMAFRMAFRMKAAPVIHSRMIRMNWPHGRACAGACMGAGERGRVRIRVFMRIMRTRITGAAFMRRAIRYMRNWRALRARAFSSINFFQEIGEMDEKGTIPGDSALAVVSASHAVARSVTLGDVAGKARRAPRAAYAVNAPAPATPTAGGWGASHPFTHWRHARRKDLRPWPATIAITKSC